MKKAKVLFFAADPHSAPPYGRSGRLLLDEDIRAIQAKVRASDHRDALEFDYRLAARSDDLIQALNEVQPAVVHFSGHGWSEGLFLMDAQGQLPHGVDRAHLAELFRVFRGQIRVVVLNACLSEPQAEAIAQVVGCAIGMREKISDAAAIAFGSAFYRAIGFGRSVQDAFDQARLAVPAGERECPQLAVGPGVDASKVFVLEPELQARPKRRAKSTGAAAGVLGVVLIGATAFHLSRDDLAACARAGVPGAPVASTLFTAGQAGMQSSLDRAKADYAKGRYAAAFTRFRELARRGDPEAMGYVGAMFLRGEGTVAHPDSGIRWLREAAYERDSRAMTALGSAYQNGEGVRHSLVRAREWYHKAVDEKQWPEAMRRLGALDRSEQKNESALTWFQKAARAGSVDARIDAGQLYEQGQGTPRDPEAALCLYRTAADAGSVRGMVVMGGMYRDGIGVSQNYGRAVKWYRRAARAGSPEAMQALGELHRDGLGVARDTAEAALWFRMARDAGNGN